MCTSEIDNNNNDTSYLTILFRWCSCRHHHHRRESPLLSLLRQQSAISPRLHPIGKRRLLWGWLCEQLWQETLCERVPRWSNEKRKLRQSDGTKTAHTGVPWWGIIGGRVCHTHAESRPAMIARDTLFLHSVSFLCVKFQ